MWLFLWGIQTEIEEFLTGATKGREQLEKHTVVKVVKILKKINLISSNGQEISYGRPGVTKIK